MFAETSIEEINSNGNGAQLATAILNFKHLELCGNGFGGLGVACWLLVPKFACSNPAEAVGFLGRKNPQHAFLRKGSKAVGPMS